MMDIVSEILKIFKENNIHAGEVLPKQKMTEALNNFPPEKKLKIRDAWHFLVGNQLIMEGNPEGPILTPRGEEYIQKHLNHK
ncbi:MAG: hypothetical protein KatS3mg068_2715 [Candidatus Sericytochromatia bacterium]|nr:MAG: hypothetical protein KatS3mg068_2715 [Candidatus Sericytochromatia bacterium]GIX40718.1 MAG: hypothetical protein KatS3mg129_0451 [Leptospiraceae bacterium]